MIYQRLKSIDGSGTIMRYYELGAAELGLCNVFYGIEDGKAKRITGAVGEGVKLIGFSHGGNNLAKGLVFLDINPSIVYMGILEESDEGRPQIGEIVNGFQRVIDTHYDGDEGVSGKGTDPEEWGVERLPDAPYYLFTIVQPDGTAYSGTIDDGDAGEESGKGTGHRDPIAIFEGQLSLYISGANAVIKYTLDGGTEQTKNITRGGIFYTAVVPNAPAALSTVYDAIAVYKEDGTTEIADLKDIVVPAEGMAMNIDASQEVTP